MTRAFFLLVALAVTFSGCSHSANVASAERAVVRFHELLDAGRFSAIFEQSSDDLKKTSTQSEFVTLLDVVHRKMGKTKSTAEHMWSVSYRTSGTYITLTYETLYSQGKAGEQFVFRIEHESATLAGYHINASALAVKS